MVTPYGRTGERARVRHADPQCQRLFQLHPRNATSTATTSFVYRADDGQGGTAQATVTITVNPVNDPPIANAGPNQTVADTDGNGSQAVTLNGTGSSDPDGDALTYSWSRQLRGDRHRRRARRFRCRWEVHTVTLSVSDGLATATDNVIITVQVRCSNAIHVADLDASTIWNARRTKWTATVTVLVHTAAHAPLGNVKVVFTLSDGTTKSCTTGTAEPAWFRRHWPACPSLTFTDPNPDPAAVGLWRRLQPRPRRRQQRLGDRRHPSAVDATHRSLRSGLRSATISSPALSSDHPRALGRSTASITR